MLKKILKILIFILILAGAGFGYLYLAQRSPSVEVGETGKTSFLPFGNLFNRDSAVDPAPTETPTENPTQPSFERQPTIVQLSNTDVAGATFLNKEREIETEEVLVFDFVDFSGYPLMREGFEGEEVSELENTLILLGTGNVGESTKTVFDIDTSGLVAFFQGESGLTPDGIAGSNTFRKINEAQEELLGESTESALAVRYIQKEDGNVYDIFVDTLESEKVSETIIPRIHEAFFSTNPDQVLLRYLKSDNETIETFGGLIEDGALSGSFFPQNIPFVSVSPDKTKVFYLTEMGEHTNGVISLFNNSQIRPVFEHAFSEWIPWWGTDSVVTLTTKASSDVSGGVYSLTTTGSLTKEFSDKNGLESLSSPNGKYVLYSESLNGNQILSVFNTQTSDHKNLGINTLSEKCTWSENSVNIYCAIPKSMLSQNLPDDWYQGRVSFEDSIWLLDIEANIHQLISDPAAEENLYLDITKIQLSDKEDYLTFVDKKTSLLYGMKI